MSHSPSHAARRLRSALCCLLLSVAFLSALGCGYHVAGSATHIPANVRTIAVPIFTTRTQAFHTELAFTQAVVRELDTRTKLIVSAKPSADADAVLAGTILTQTAVPLTYDSTSGETSSYLITVTAKVTLTARDGRVLYRNDTLSFREQYQSTLDLSGSIPESGPAVDRLSHSFAQSLVSDMLESF
jgi:outer membrane lipopolysaccharide assembly protein LptE/RlpB